MDVSNSTYLAEWKEKMRRTVRLKYSEDQLSDAQLNAYLDKQIEERLVERKVIVVNNYTNKCKRNLSILQLIEMIRKNHLICAGGGCLFLPHGEKRNLLIEFILHIMAGRKNAKKMRRNFEKGTKEWSDWDLTQLAFKLIINSLYGCLGYPGFIMFNIFLAESITTQGRHIITSAVNAIEGFFGDAMYYENSSEVYHVVDNIVGEFHKKVPGGSLSVDVISIFAKSMNLRELPEAVTQRFLKHCIFSYDQSFEDQIRSIFYGMNTSMLLMLYFKNNFMEFSRLSFIKERIRKVLDENGLLMTCEYPSPDDRIKGYSSSTWGQMNELWELYDFFVHYNYPVFDRIQKAMYIDKERSLYTDTDSVFISLNEFIQFISHEIYHSPEEAGLTQEELTFTAANFTLTIANNMIGAAMNTLCASIGVPPEYAKLLAMKNEFFFSRIMFTEVKKRYVSLALLQEGQLLRDKDRDFQLGLPEVKGFDFKKAGTKPFVRKFCEDLCVDEIMKPEKISPVRIFKKVLDFKALMESTIHQGNMDFFKQANVKKPEYYAKPYSNQGVCAVMLWNALMPEKMLEFPTDVNIVPIRRLTWERPPKPKDDESGPIRSTAKSPLEYKEIAEFAERFPEAYEKLHSRIYSNPNPAIRHMNLTSIAIPKNMDYELPEYITSLYNIESVVNATLGLILPLMKAIGIKSFQVTSNLEYMSNMVSV